VENPQDVHCTKTIREENSTAYCRLARRPVDSMKSVPSEATLLRVEVTLMAMAYIITFSETPTSASE
jgi:hypothetical protein